MKYARWHITPSREFRCLPPLTAAHRRAQAILQQLRAAGCVFAGCVFAEEEAALLAQEAKTQADLEAMVARRVSGLPLEQVVGWVLFRGLRITLLPTVFVLRLRTEFLVGAAIALTAPGAVVLDLCCGAGALSAALAMHVNAADSSRRLQLYASDIEHAAVECARENLAMLGGVVYEGDLFDPLPDSLRGRVNILLANVPYVPSDAIGLLPPEAREYEPLAALDGGADGLAVLRRVSAEAFQWLAPGGYVFFETSERQALSACESVSESGLHASIARSEEYDATVVVGQYLR